MPKRLFEILLDEVSLVDNPANKGARVVLFKRDTGKGAPNVDEFIELFKSLYDGEPNPDFSDALSEEMDREEARRVNDIMWPLMDALRESVLAAAAEMNGEARDAKIRSNVEQFLVQVEEKLGELDASPGVEKILEIAGFSGSPPSKGDDMTIEELQKKLGELEVQVAELTKERDGALEKAEAAQKDAEKALEAAAKEAGVEIGKSDDGKLIVKKAEPNDDDFVEIDGEKVAKSAVPAPLLKKLEKQDQEIEDLRKRQEAEDLRKRAESELPNLSGDMFDKGALLKAVDGIEDEKVRENVVKSLRAADAAVSKMFESVGDNPADDEDSATAKLNKLAKDYASEKGCSFEQGFAEVVKTKEGRELRKRSDEERAAN